MADHTGIFLKSTPLLDGTVFENAIIFVAENNEKGSLGFITNKLSPRKLNELNEFRNSIPLPLYDGGPVDQEHLFFLHQRPDLIIDSVHIKRSIYMGGDFKQAIIHINDNLLTEKDIRVFVGYCGWDYQQLEAEIEEGSWLVQNKRHPFE